MTTPRTLQDIHLAAAPEIQGLAWRIGSVDPGCDTAACADTVPVLRSGDTLRLDTFLNCFYERYWRELTPLATFAVEIVASGSCTIRLTRSTSGQPLKTVAEAESLGQRTVTTLTAPSDPDGGGVLHVEIEAGSGPVQVHAGRWIATKTPVNRVALVIAICSFGREDMVAATLSSMSEVVARSALIRKVVVVHQGPTDLAEHPSIRDLLAGDRLGEKLQIIRQGNFGGAGGFARGMIEGLSLEATNLLLMDDDIRLEPSVLDRLTTLLSYLEKPTTLGGQMLTLDEPATLHASHERVDLGRMRLVNAYQGVDLSSAEPSHLFRDVHASDYNAWWFCCIPVEAIRDVGLPLPIFFRFDDIDHGLRTIRSGWPLLTVPGLFVWHEAFGPKIKPWQAYYERRNILVCAALHGRASAIRYAAFYTREAWIGLAIGRYDYCWAVCRAAADFLDGPDVVFSDSALLHQTIIAEAGRHMLRALHDYHRGRARKPGPGETLERRSKVRLTLALLTSLPSRNASAGFRRRLALSVVRMGIGLWLKGDRAARVYRAQARDHTTVTFWKDRLGLRPGQAPS